MEMGNRDILKSTYLCNLQNIRVGLLHSLNLELVTFDSRLFQINLAADNLIILLSKSIKLKI